MCFPWKYVFFVDCVWNVMAHAQKLHFVFRRNGRVHLIRQGRQFSRLLAVEMCASAVVMLDTPCSEVVWRVLVTHSIRQFPLRFPSPTSPCAITFQLDSTTFRCVIRGLGGREEERERILPSKAYRYSVGWNLQKINARSVKRSTKNLPDATHFMKGGTHEITTKY
jgi:hypothetical protein